MHKYVGYTETQSEYKLSPIEIEACILMMVENAYSSNDKIKTYEELVRYAKQTTDENLITAKCCILSNEIETRDILEHNKIFLESVDQHLQEEDLKFNIKATAIPPRKNSMKNGYKCIPYWKYRG